MTETESVSRIDSEDSWQVGILGLTQLVAGKSSVAQTLTRIVELALRSFPDAGGAGVVMVAGTRESAASSPSIGRLEELQQRRGTGPAIDAATLGRPVHSGALDADTRWRQLSGQATRLGLYSVLALPLLIPDETVGTLTVWAGGRDAFDTAAVEFGELFAGAAAVAAHNSRTVTDAELLAGRLQAALINRAVIDQAVGIIMSRTGDDPAAALGRLQTLARQSDVSPTAVAQRVVDKAIRRARTGRATA